MNATIAIASVLALLMTIAGAIGAHHIPASSADLMASWNSALLFGLVHVLASILAATLAPTRPLARYAGWAFLFGVVAFSLTILVSVAARSQHPDGGIVGGIAESSIIAPTGGAAFMIGWALMVIASLRDRT